MTLRIALFSFFVMLYAVAETGADIYRYVDENGVIHLTNMPKHSKYKLVLRGADGLSAAHADHTRYDPIIDKLSRKHGVSFSLVKAVIKAESSFNPNAVSKKGAQGLMQLMPAKAKELNVDDPFNPKQNIDGGVRLLRSLLDRYDGNLTLALAAYNAGENAVARYNNTIPPFPETQEYIRRVLNFLQEF